MLMYWLGVGLLCLTLVSLTVVLMHQQELGRV